MRGLSVELADRADGTPLIHYQRIDRCKVDRDDGGAGGARVGDQGAMGFGAPLIAEVDLRLFVTDEDRAGSPELGGEAAEHRTFGYRKQPCARSRELEHHGSVVLAVDPLDDL